MAFASEADAETAIARTGQRPRRPIVQPPSIRELLDQAGYRYDRRRDLPELLGVLPFHDDRSANPDDMYTADIWRAIHTTKAVISDLFCEIHRQQRLASEGEMLWTYHQMHLLCRAFAAEQLTISWLYRQKFIEAK
jgi:hypothetical protein